MATPRVNGQRKGIQSIELGFTVLDCIERAGGPLPLTKIAQACGMTASKAHFYLVSLSRVGLVAQDSLGGHYRLGPAALRIGLSALAQQDVLELARAEMGRLSEVTGDTVFLSVWGHNGATVISRFDGVNVAPLAVRVGAVMPLLRSATGRMFLAWLPLGHVKSVLRGEAEARIKGVPRSLAGIRSLAGEVRRDGIALTPGAVAPEMIAIAAPVFDHTSQLQCVLTLTEQARHLDRAGRNKLIDALRRSAEAVSRAAGYPGDAKRRPRVIEATPAPSEAG
jgi:DNA-binding IclR family transcriptional regulator